MSCEETSQLARENLNDLSAFVAVAQAHSFTKAAARLGISPSALSHAMRGLEERRGVRLLARTPGASAPTEAGERLLTVVLPHLQGIKSGLNALNLLRDIPAGTIRLTASEHPACTVIYPVLARLAADYPQIKIEVNVHNMLADLVAGRFDAGIRLGEHVERDMVAARIAPDMRMAVVGTPAYFERPPAARNSAGSDKTRMHRHTAANPRRPVALGVRQGWSLGYSTRGRPVDLQHDEPRSLRAVLDGLGLGYCLDDMAAEAIADGRLIRVLEDWCEPFPGYHIYYPSRCLLSPALRLLIDALRFR